MGCKLAVIGVGNMAKAIISGALSSELNIDRFFLYDKFTSACDSFLNVPSVSVSDSIKTAVESADYVMLSVKPQNYPEVLESIKAIPLHNSKIYISIGAGITVKSDSDALDGATVIRVLPNLPMTIGLGVSAICSNEKADKKDFDLVTKIFSCSSSTIIIDEDEMNRIIGVTSSSPAYVFKFIDAICKGAAAQGLDGDSLINAVCDVIIGSATLLKQSSDSPADLIKKVASKGGTTEQALLKLDEGNFDEIVKSAMIACTKRADELGKQ
jgi:pyrroline-5-carboxylate reductase